MPLTNGHSEFPLARVAAAANVNALLDVAGLWLKEAPAPLGRPEVPESHLAGKAA